jgi:hypothetical protein
MTQQILAVAVLVSAILAAGVGLVRVGTWLSRLLRKVGHLADDLIGEPPRPGAPEGRPGVLARLDRIEEHLSRLDGFEARLAEVEAQLRPNGGNSIRDQVTRIEQATTGADRAA